MFIGKIYDVVPYMMAVVKALTCGYVPMGSTIVNSEVAEVFMGGTGEVLRHS